MKVFRTQNIGEKQEKFLLKRIQQCKGTAYHKRGTFSNSLIWGNTEFFIRKGQKRQKKNFQDGLFLFAIVKKEAKEFLKRNPVIKLPRKYNQIEYNGNIDNDAFGKIMGTDLNHAYWRIAYNLGVISESTYLKGLPDKFKSIRLAALSTLGAPKPYLIIRNGEPTKEYKLVDANEKLQQVYKLIRYTCYGYMHSVKRKLGKDFICYKTDCIYYTNTAKNRTLVEKFFESKDISYKHLK